MISPRYKLSNRADKRLFQKEANRVLKPLMTIEAKFIGYLFDETQEWSYQALFHAFKLEYKAEAEHLSSGWKMLVVDLEYFEQTYKPQEYASKLRD